MGPISLSWLPQGRFHRAGFVVASIQEPVQSFAVSLDTMWDGVVRFGSREEWFLRASGPCATVLRGAPPRSWRHGKIWGVHAGKSKFRRYGTGRPVPAAETYCASISRQSWEAKSRRPAAGLHLRDGGACRRQRSGSRRQPPSRSKRISTILAGFFPLIASGQVAMVQYGGNENQR